jgi:hypothetical protein
MRPTPPFRRAALVTAIAVASITRPDVAVSQGQAAAVLPANLADYLSTSVRLAPAAQAQMLAGQPVTKLLDVDPTKEVAVFGIVWVNAPIAKYIAAVRDIERFEQGEGYAVSKRVSTPPRLSDFDRMTLPDEDVTDLRSCRVGDCEVKLSEASLKRIKAEIDWKKPSAKADVERLMRQIAFEFTTSYLDGGNARLSVYRDRDRPTLVAQEFQQMVEQMPALSTYLPEIKRYLLGFPKVSLPNSESFLYWQDARFGLKPTIKINHLTIAEDPSGAVVVSKMLYSSHYFWTALELRVLLPDPARGNGFWFANVNQSRADGLTGFMSSVIRDRARSEGEKAVQSTLRMTKARMEQP